jgi:hypothetical protein
MVILQGPNCQGPPESQVNHEISRRSSRNGQKASIAVQPHGACEQAISSTPVIHIGAALAVGEAVEEPAEAKALALLKRLAFGILEVAKVLLTQLNLLLNPGMAVLWDDRLDALVCLNGAPVRGRVEEEFVRVPTA